MTSYVSAKSLMTSSTSVQNPGRKKLVALTITGVATLDVPNPDRMLVVEDHAAIFEGSVLPMGTQIDRGNPKPWGEYFVLGNAAVPGGDSLNPAQASSVNVEVQFMGQTKKITVFGDRYWQPSPSGFVYTAPEPFSRMPLGAHLAFGGADFEPNVMGRGVDAEARLTRQEPVLLPNIEYANQLIKSIDDRPEPVCMWPRSVIDANKMKYAGTYNDEWMKEGKQGLLPKDFDPRFFCEAPEDQWIKGFFNGDEPFVFSGFSAIRPRFEGKLPGFRVRTFVAFQDNKDELVEVGTRLDTICFLPSTAKAVMFWRAIVECQHETGEDVFAFVTGYERPEWPKDDAYYYDCYKKWQDPEKGFLQMQRSDFLAPTNSPETLNVRFKAREAFRASENDKRRRTRDILIEDAMTLSGTPMSMLPELPDIEPLPDFLPTPQEIKLGECDYADVLDGMDQLHKKLMAEVDSADANEQGILSAASVANDNPSSENMDNLLKSLGDYAETPITSYSEISSKVEEEADRAKKASPFIGDELDGMMERIKNPHQESKNAEDPYQSACQRFDGAGFSFMSKIDEMLDKIPEDIIDKRQIDEMDKIGKLPKQEQSFNFDTMFKLRKEVDAPSEIHESLQEARAQLFEKEQQLKKLFPKIEVEEGQSPLEAFAQTARKAFPQKETIPSDPREINTFIKEKIKKSRDEVEELMQFNDPLILARRESPLPIAPDPMLYEENAKRFGLYIKDALKSGISLKNKDCAGASMEGFDFSYMDMEGVMFENANLTNAKFTGANLRNAIFTKVFAPGADFSGANLEGANLHAINVKGGNFQNANLKDVKFMTAIFSEANFSSTSIADMLFIETDFSGAKFNNTSIKSLSLLNCNFINTEMCNSDINNLVFVECLITNCSFQGSTMETIIANNTDCTGANYSSCKIKQLFFDEASIVNNVDFSNSMLNSSSFISSNLIGSNFRGVKAENISFHQANLSFVDMSLADFTDCLFYRASLIGANAFGTNFCRASLKETNCKGGRFRNANFFMADLEDVDFLGADLSNANLSHTKMGERNDGTSGII